MAPTPLSPLIIYQQKQGGEKTEAGGKHGERDDDAQWVAEQAGCNAAAGLRGTSPSVLYFILFPMWVLELVAT